MYRAPTNRGWPVGWNLFCFVGEGDFGFFVEHQRADEAVRVAGMRDVDGDRKNPSDASPDAAIIPRATQKPWGDVLKSGQTFCSTFMP